MYLTTFTDKEGNRLEHNKLKSVWNIELKKYMEERQRIYSR